MLPRYARIRKAREFRAVFSSRGDSRARVVSTPALVLHMRPQRRSPAARSVEAAGASVAPALLRFGFSISKKVSKRSHDRNRLKRRLSEIARREVLPAYAGPMRYDCVVVVRPGAAQAGSGELSRDLRHLLRRAGIGLAQIAPDASGQPEIKH